MRDELADVIADAYEAWWLSKRTPAERAADAVRAHIAVALDAEAEKWLVATSADIRTGAKCAIDDLRASLLGTTEAVAAQLVDAIIDKLNEEAT